MYLRETAKVPTGVAQYPVTLAVGHGGNPCDETQLGTKKKRGQACSMAVEEIMTSVYTVAKTLLDEIVEGERRGRWRGRLYGPQYIYRPPLTTWAKAYLGEGAWYPPRTFSNAFRLPRALLRNLHEDWVRYGGAVRRTRHVAVGRVGICSEVNVLMYIRLRGSETSLRKLEDSVYMGKETIEGYFQKNSRHVTAMYGAV